MMHRTVSIDYVICTHGDVRMETATGEMVDLKPGVRTSSCGPLSCLVSSCWDPLGVVKKDVGLCCNVADGRGTGSYYPARHDAQVA